MKRKFLFGVAQRLLYLHLRYLELGTLLYQPCIFGPIELSRLIKRKAIAKSTSSVVQSSMII